MNTIGNFGSLNLHRETEQGDTDGHCQGHIYLKTKGAISIRTLYSSLLVNLHYRGFGFPFELGTTTGLDTETMVDYIKFSASKLLSSLGFFKPSTYHFST